MNEVKVNELNKLYDDFLKEFPIERLEKLRLEEYTNLEKNNSFCYWLETKTQKLGSIWGGSSYKFGIFRWNQIPSFSAKAKNDDKYAWYLKYGSTAQEAFENIRKNILEVAKYSIAGEFEKIDDIDLGNAYKWKIAFLYSNKKLLNCYEKTGLKWIAKKQGLEVSPKTKISQIQAFLMDKKGGEDVFEFSKKLWKEWQNSNEYKMSKNNDEVGNEMENKFIDEIVNVLKYKKNIILQGAPGVGKTYNTAMIALEICGIKTENLKHEEVMAQYEELRKSGQIEFVTFHQSMDYEDFVEGIKPEITENSNVSYEVKDGIFKEICKSATYGNNGSDNFKTAWEKLVEKLNEVEIIEIPLLSNENKKIRIELNEYGTGLATRTYENDEFKKDNWIKGKSKFYNYEQLYNVYIGLPGIPSGGHDNYRKAIVAEMKRSFGLQDFIVNKNKDDEIFENGFKKLKDIIKSNGAIECETKRGEKIIINNINDEEIYITNKVDKNYNIQKSILSDIVKEFQFSELISDKILVKDIEKIYGNYPGTALAVLRKIYELDKSDKTKNYVLIIDEINRGNVSKIFGEIITLLESDKRLGGEHPLRVTLPYSKKDFGIPNNLYIIGTMNTTDRSVGSIDYAVRRRFAFVTLPADESVLDKYPKGKEVFEAVSKFIKDNNSNDIDFDDLMVGHSYFMADDYEQLKLKLKYEILPLLEEYYKDGILKEKPNANEFFEILNSSNDSE